jgi:hypothetical protein
MLALGLMGFLSGCDTTGAFLETAVPTSSEAPTQVMAFWQRSVATTEDWVNNGRSLSGISGCVYLIGPDGTTPVAGDGELVVSLLHNIPRPGADGPAEIYQWKFDSATLKGLLKTDRVGACYPLFLPWPEHVPMFSQIQLKVRYNQANRVPLFNVGQAFTMDTPPAQKPAQTVTAGMRPRGF